MLEVWNSWEHFRCIIASSLVGSSIELKILVIYDPVDIELFCTTIADLALVNLLRSHPSLLVSLLLAESAHCTSGHLLVAAHVLRPGV